MKNLSKLVGIVLMVFVFNVIGVSSVVAQETSDSYYPVSFIGTFSNNNASNGDNSWLNSTGNLLLKFAINEPSVAMVKSAKLSIRLKDYDTKKPGAGVTIGTMKNDWKTGATYADTLGMAGFILNASLVSGSSVDTTSNNTMFFDVTDDYKARISQDMAISYYVYDVDGTDNWITRNDKQVSLIITYCSETEILEAINGATEINIADYLPGLKSVYAEQYARLNDKTSVNTAMAGKSFATMADVISAFETAMLEYLQNPSAEDVVGYNPEKIYSYSDFVFVERDSSATAGDLGWFDNDNVKQNTLVKFITTEKSAEIIKKAEFSVSIKDVAGWQGVNGYSENSLYKFAMGSIKNDWSKTSPYTETLGVAGFILNEGMAAGKFVNGASEANTRVDITSDFKKRILDSQTVSYYMLNNKGDKFMIRGDGNAIKLIITYYNDAEIVEFINSASSETIESYIVALDTEYAQKYERLNYKDTVNAAMVGKNFTDMTAVITAFKSAMSQYLENPVEADEEGEIVTVVSELYGRAKKDGSSLIESNYAYVGGYSNDAKPLIRFDVTNINIDFVKTAQFSLETRKEIGDWWTYSSAGDYTSDVSVTKNEWQLGDTYQTTFATAGFIIAENIAKTRRIDRGDYGIITADVTESLKEYTTEGKITYHLQLSNVSDENCYVFDDTANMMLTIEYMNGYDLMKKFSEIDTQEEMLSFAQGLIDVYDIEVGDAAFIAEVIEGRNFENLEEMIEYLNSLEFFEAVIVKAQKPVVSTNITGTFAVKNLTDAPKLDFEAIVAGYDTDNKMIDVYIAPLKEVVAQSTTADIEYELTKDVSEIDTVKIFLWNSWERMGSYCLSTEMDVGSATN